MNPSKRRFRFSLRSLGAVSLLLGAGGGLFGSQAISVYQAHCNVRLLEEQGAVVTSDFQARYGLFPWERRATWKSLLEWTVAAPDEISAPLTRSPQVRQMVQPLSRLSSIRWLNLAESEFSSEDVEYLASLCGLEDLCLSGTEIDDSALQSLTALHRLRRLDLSDTAISDGGLKTIASMNSLKLVNLANTGISRRGVRELHRMRPDLAVSLPPSSPPRRKTRTLAQNSAMAPPHASLHHSQSG